MKDFWKSIWTIFKREIVAQFSSPMAYIFLVGLLLVSTALFLFLPPFFAFPVAEMTGYFGWLVPVLCVFAPAATMRIWAEDRKENTIELLLTFPISAPALVLGKFLAAFAFYLVALACTWVLPLMLAWLGAPDWGPIFSGYFGAVLLGALFIALGMFISGFCRDQVTAFVLSFFMCGLISLVGWEAVVTILEGSVGALGTLVATLFGMTGHYTPFTRGVVVMSDVLYFLAWTALFLFLNGVYLEGRSRPQATLRFVGTIALAAAVGALFNWVVTDMDLGRADLTEGNIHSVSEASTRILGRLKVPVNVNLYISPASKMPAPMRSLERDIMARLEEMRVASGRMLRPSVKHMEAAKVLRDLGDDEEEEEGDEKSKKKSLEERLIEKGVKPFSVRDFQEDQTTTKLIYSSIGVAYKEKEEEIIPNIMPQNLPDLEYRLMNVVFKITRVSAPTVALVAPFQVVNVPPQMREMLMRMGRMPPQRDDPYEYLQRVLEHEKFDVKRVKFEKGDGLPDDYDTLAVINPREFGDRHRWEIARALHAGRSVFLAVQDHAWSYSMDRRTISANKREENPGINDLLSEYGIEVDPDTLMDANHQPLTTSDRSNPFAMMMGGGITLNLPTHIAIKSESMNPDVSITSRLGDLFYLWGSRLKLDEEKLEENKLEVKTLFTTSENAWTVSTGTRLGPGDIEPPADTKRMPLAIIVQGQFPDVYADEERPAWPDKPPPTRPGMPPPPPPADEDEGPPEPVDPAPAKLIIVGCSELFTRNFLSRGNLDFFMNSIDALTLGEDLIHIRSKKPISRTIGRTSDFGRTFWKFMTLAFMSVVVIAAGIARMGFVRQSRARYRASLKSQRDSGSPA